MADGTSGATAAAPATTTSTITTSSTSYSGRLVGCIRPPPDIRAVADKTAAFVAEKGEEYERKIMARGGESNKFSFLTPTNPYHAYYRMKVAELRGEAAGAAAGADAPTAAAGGASAPAPASETTSSSSGEAAAPSAAAATAPSSAAAATQPPAAAARAATLLNPLSKALRAVDLSAPPPRDEYTAEPPAGGGRAAGGPAQIGIIKVTAQFTAVGGKAFLAALTQREFRNPEFDFLKSTHLLFPYFTALVDAYSRIVHPPPGTAARLAADNLDGFLGRSVARCEAEREATRQREAAAGRAAAESSGWEVDWGDFVIVETLTLDDDDDALPASRPVPLPTAAVAPPAAAAGGARSSAAGGGAGVAAAAARPAPAAGGSGGGGVTLLDDAGETIRVRTDYTPSLPVAPAGATVTGFYDATTGRTIPAASAAEQMRVELLDPRWKTQQATYLARRAETALAPGDQVAENLKRLAGSRADIFSERGGEPPGAKRPRPATDDTAPPGT